MKENEIEPGLLSIFRLFMVVHMGLILVLVLTLGVHKESSPHPGIALLVMFIFTIFLFGYLSWPYLQKRLGVWYLPLALVGASVLPLAGQYLAYQNQPNFTPIDWMDFAFQQMLLIFPLLLISWQYGIKWSIWFSVATGLIDFLLASLIFSSAQLEITRYGGVLFVRVLTFIAVGYVVARLMKAQRFQRQSLRETNLKLVNYTATLEQLATSQERNRLARELHDTLAHTLSGIAVQLEAANSLWNSRPEQAHLLYQQSLAVTRNGLTETRRALRELRATPLEDMGLSLALQNLAEAVAERNGLLLDLHIEENCNNFPVGVEQGFYRMAQEALENTARHAQASCVKVELVRRGQTLMMTVADDGQGFEPQAVGPESHFGLRGLYERAEMLGGHLEIDSQPGKGTTIRLQVET